MKENNDTLYDIVFADEIRAKTKSAGDKFSEQVRHLIDTAVPYHNAIWDAVKLTNIPYKDWSSSASMVEILEEAHSDLFVVKEIEEAIYQAFINTPIGGYHI